MDRFSRNCYQNFANFSEMAISWSILVLHPRNHTFTDQFSRNWYQNFANFTRMETMVVFLSLTSSPTHPLTHPRTYPRTHTFMDQFSRNWYQHFGNFSGMATMW